jgi:hypothetical protein
MQFATVARTEGGELQQLRALVGSTRKSSAFGFNGSRLRLRTCGGMLSKSGGSLQVPGNRPSNNSFKPNPLRSFNTPYWFSGGSA